MSKSKLERKYPLLHEAARKLTATELRRGLKWYETHEHTAEVWRTVGSG